MGKQQEDVSLVPIKEQTVDFYGDELVAVLVEIEGHQHVYVPLRPICLYMGITWQGQLERLKRDAVLADVMQGVSVTLTPKGKRGGGPQTMVAIPLEFLAGWLFSINADRVKLDIREKITRYRRECFRVLWQAFQAEAIVATMPTVPTAAVLSLAQIEQMGLAIAQMARQQMEMEQAVEAHGAQIAAHDDRLTGHDTRLDRAAQVVGELQRRLSAVERRTAPAATITDAQAADVSGQVKALADMLTRHDPSKNHYQGVFMELYRRFGVSSYKLIRQEDYAAVLTFLDEWRQTADK